MKLRTSSYKPIALKKDIFRFAPVWALYTIALVLVLPSFSYSTYDRFARNFFNGSIPAFGVVNLGYAFLCANLLMGDLFNTKLCYSLHAMPFKRHQWLSTHLMAGMLFSLVPNLLATGVLMLKMKAYWFLALYWLLAVTLQFLFFYGLAVLSALLTGNRFAHLAIYGIMNFISMLLYAGINVLYIPSLEGVQTNLEDFSRFSPAVQLFRYDYVKFTRVETTKVEPHIGTIRETFFRFDGLTDGWGYLAILAGVAVGLMTLCYWLYRKRQLESAGDFVAFSRLKGPMCLILTFCVTIVFSMLGMAFDGFVVWMAVGLTVGYFCSLMLLERRIKVFRKKTFLNFGILVVVAVLSVLAVEFDWFGIEKWTPEADRVKSVTVSNYNTENDYYYSEGYGTTLTEPEDIARIIVAHEDILERLDEKYVNSRHRVYLTYTLKSGRVVRRSYNAPAIGENYEIIRFYLYTCENLLGFTSAETAAKQVSWMSFNGGQIPKEHYATVLALLQQDAMEDNISVDYKVDGLYIEYQLEKEDGYPIYRSVFVLPKAQHLTTLVKDPTLMMGYSDWESFLETVFSVSIEHNGIYREIVESEYAGLMEALRKDVEAGNAKSWNYNDGDIILNYQDHNYYRTFYLGKEAEHVRAWLSARENDIAPQQ